MKLTCPNCREQFEVDKSHYSELVAQVRNQEFDAEIERRLRELSAVQEAKEKAIRTELEMNNARELAKTEALTAKLKEEITTLKAQISNFDADKQRVLAEANTEKVRALAEIAQQKEKEISELKADIKTLDAQRKYDIESERNLQRDAINERERKITELNAELRSQEATAKTRELELRANHELLMKAKDEEIERYKDLKSRLSTKMLGETLEQHCQNSFNQARSQGMFEGCYFEKDNDASSGTKGDFIFRDYINGEECISIMFEMKHEADTTAIKHRNEDFFAKLHKDRTEKKCDYAVLVTTLEADNEFYNSGIVDVSYRYEKMFVVRPQFFLPIISLLSRSAKKEANTIITLRQELAVAKAQSVDVTKFEEKRDKFAADFRKYIEAHCKKHEDAIGWVDKAIEAAEKQIVALRKIKDAFDTSTQKLMRAGDVIEQDLTIKKLSYGNPTMKRLFEEAKQGGDD